MKISNLACILFSLFSINMLNAMGANQRSHAQTIKMVTTERPMLKAQKMLSQQTEHIKEQASELKTLRLRLAKQKVRDVGRAKCERKRRTEFLFNVWRTDVYKKIAAAHAETANDYARLVHLNRGIVKEATKKVDELKAEITKKEKRIQEVTEAIYEHDAAWGKKVEFALKLSTSKDPWDQRIWAICRRLNNPNRPGLYCYPDQGLYDIFRAMEEARDSMDKEEKVNG